MEKIIEIDEVCKACKGTGIFIGFAEKDGYGVICKQCDGTGKCHFVHIYEEFVERKERDDVKQVLQANPGIMVGNIKGESKNNFGGITYEEWLKTGTFPKKTEMRNYTCPAWWYQSADYRKKPEWEECTSFGSFSDCKNFKNKEKCWDKFDAENN